MVDSLCLQLPGLLVFVLISQVNDLMPGGEDKTPLRSQTLFLLAVPAHPFLLICPVAMLTPVTLPQHPALQFAACPSHRLLTCAGCDQLYQVQLIGLPQSHRPPAQGLLEDAQVWNCGEALAEPGRWGEVNPSGMVSREKQINKYSVHG